MDWFLRRWWLKQEASYGREPGMLGSYLTLMSVYAASTGSAALLARRLGRPAPAAPTPWELAQLAAATHKLSRLIAKDAVTSPVRAPFTEFHGTSAPSELAEEVRGHGLQHSVGELLTCPMCLAQWVATAFVLGKVIAPAATQACLTVFSAVAGADFLQHAYVLLQQASE